MIPMIQEKNPKILLWTIRRMELIFMEIREIGRFMREAGLEEKDTSLVLHILGMRYSLDIQNEKSGQQMYAYVISVLAEHYAKNINSGNIKLYIDWTSVYRTGWNYRGAVFKKRKGLTRRNNRTKEELLGK